MNLSIRNLFLLAALAIAPLQVAFADEASPVEAVTPVTETPAQQGPTPEQVAAINEYMNTLVEQISSHLHHTTSIIQHLALLVTSGQIKNIDHAATRKQLEKLKAEVDFAQQLAQGEMNINKIILLHSYTQIMVQYLHDIIDNGLQNFPDFDAYAGLMQKRSEDIAKKTGPELEQSLAATEQSLIELEKSADSVGLTVFNKFMRSIDRVSKQHKLSKRAVQAVAGSFLLYVLLSRAEPEWLEKVPGLPAARKFFGDMPVISLDSNLWMNKKADEVTFFTASEVYLRRLGLGNFMATPMITLGSLAGIFQDDAYSLYRWSNKKASDFINYVRGGEAKKTEMTFLKEPRVRFSDVIGRQDAKQVASHIVDYIVNPARFDRSKISPEKGYLLAGPSRSGKTYFAEALAGEIRASLKAIGKDSFNFFTLHASDVQKFGIATVLREARELSPCVLFIDEIDMLGLQRERNAEMLSTFLTELSGCMNHDEEKKIILIGATNLPENLDPALLQHGRIGTTLWFYHPNYEERIAYIQREFAKRLINVSPEYMLKFARETERKSFEDINAVIVDAFMKAKQRNSAVSEKELEQAFDRIVRNITEDPLTVAAQDKMLYAVHQAGKAFAQLSLGKNNKLSKVTIKRVEYKVREKSVWSRYENNANNIENKNAIFGQIFTHRAEGSGVEYTHEDLEIEAKVALAGHIAEQALLGHQSLDYYGGDEPSALAMCRYLAYNGNKKEVLPKEEQKRLDTLAYNTLNKYKQEVTQLITDNKKVIEGIAAVLAHYETLTAEDIQQVITAIKEMPEAAPAPAVA